eukprot:GHVL01009098.1.p1 GENE.GHVL01009098.1~~GHVL01009098.1.p1  ORF type:complete len:391 (+),score=32.36 GHVL01009098.1:245-1417(+)
MGDQSSLPAADQYFEHTKIIKSAAVETYIKYKHHVMLLYRRYDPPADKQKTASLCIFHGFGEHSARYEAMANFFKEYGFVTHTVDFQGFGLSGGARNSANLDAFEKDVKTLLRQVDPSIPCFVLGHSMGGLTVLKFCLSHPELPLAGVIFSSPLFRLHSSRKTTLFKRFLVNAMSGLSEMFLVANVDPSQLTRDRQEVVTMLHDRFCLPMMGMSLAASLTNEPYNLLPHRAQEFKFPVLLFHGGYDKLTDPKATEWFHSLCSSEDKTLKIFPHSFHEVHQDINKQEMYDLCLEWMLQRIPIATSFVDIRTNYINPLKKQKQLKKMIQKKLYPFRFIFFSIIYLVIMLIFYIRGRRIKQANGLMTIINRLIRTSLWPLKVFLLAMDWLKRD